MNPVKKEVKEQPILIHEDTKSIIELRHKVDQAVTDLNEIICKSIPLTTHEELYQARRNAKEIVNGISLQRNPTFQLMLESNENFKVPLSSDLKLLQATLESISGDVYNLTVFYEKAWGVNTEKLEHEINTKYRSFVTKGFQKKQLDHALHNASFLNSLSKAERRYYLNNHSDIRTTVSQGEPGMIKADDSFDGEFKINPSFVLNELKDVADDRPTVERGFGIRGSGELISDKSRDHDPRRSKLLKDLTPRELEQLEYERLARQA